MRKKAGLALNNVRYGKEPIFHNIHYFFKGPQIYQLRYELEMTNGLGYKHIGYHEDSEKGLTRHLGEMEKRVRENDWVYERMTKNDLFGALLASEDALMFLRKAYKTDIREIGNYAISCMEEISRAYMRSRDYTPKPKGNPPKPKNEKGLLSRIFKYSRNPNPRMAEKQTLESCGQDYCVIPTPSGCTEAGRKLMREIARKQ